MPLLLEIKRKVGKVLILKGSSCLKPKLTFCLSNTLLFASLTTTHSVP